MNHSAIQNDRRKEKKDSLFNILYCYKCLNKNKYLQKNERKKNSF